MQKLPILFQRYLNNLCTTEEIEVLLRYFGQEKSADQLKKLIEQQLLAEVSEDFEKNLEVQQVFTQTDEYLKKILLPKQNNFLVRILPYVRYAAVASVFVMLATTFYLLNHHKPEQHPQEKQLVNDASPGTDKAILTLADGTSVELGTGDSETILKQSGIKITKTKDGMLVYEVKQQSANPNIMQYNELHTPNGAKYEVLLPDGTKVWLNASSTLRYPIAFASNERRVSLKGEAYFEVEKVTNNQKRIPFYVETEGQLIQVLGTEFNVSAYADDLSIKTTLISGKVNVSQLTNQVVLNPGEQAMSSPSEALTVIKVNTEPIIAWKNGNFMFEDMDLKDILKQLSRWYNVEVEFDKLPQTRYNMLISRNETLKSALNMLERTGNIKFQIVNNTIKINK